MPTDSADGIAVHRSVPVRVPLSRRRAFDLFTARMTEFWPRGQHIAALPFQEIVVEPRPDGRWFERDAAGNEAEWGRVIDWAPPGRLLLGWQRDADWAPSPELETEVELRFTEQDANHTLVELTHRHLERLGDQAERIRALFGQPDAWEGVLGAFAESPILGQYLNSIEYFGRILRKIPGDAWENATPCTEWTVRDIVGHTIWGAHRLLGFIGVEPAPDPRFSPKGEPAGRLAGEDPIASWQGVHEQCRAALEPVMLTTAVEHPAVATVGSFIRLLITDITAHSWDIGRAIKTDVRFPEGLLRASEDWARKNTATLAGSGFFAAALTPPKGADAQTRLLAQLGRRAW
ncbi:TIGR03086 family metal-binding protein [Sciscionella marina]|uniref:TIGR03086 family metal-binding protein n=1 Tax=Sciscionella marina TaxID=508770 RepID=UPI00035EE49C|nr:TIGR03086 family metal-binding protein [Sciscionella marina]